MNDSTYPKDIVDDADSREPWPSKTVRDWYMEGRMVERESSRSAWWVATNQLADGGKKIAGPFSSSEDALVARTAFEARDETDQYWVVQA